MDDQGIKVKKEIRRNYANKNAKQRQEALNQ